MEEGGLAEEGGLEEEGGLFPDVQWDAETRNGFRHIYFIQNVGPLWYILNHIVHEYNGS